MRSIIGISIKAAWLLAVCLSLTTFSFAQPQIPINRIEMMPNKPSPYIMRDWKKVALDYNSLIFDLNLKGEYLPLTHLHRNTVNYPEQESFHQHTFVGDTTRNESINSFMAIVGATLCGVDMRRHYGKDWVLMIEEWYNRKSGLNLYTDAVGGVTGKDWWYDIIPNVLFYQIYDLYGNVGHFEEQFTTIADQWIRCVEALGGQIEPKKLPDMNYRSFNFATMKPLVHKIPEPEAAGAIGWILHQAYIKTGQIKYLKWSEICLERYSSYEKSPVYELQYLYGTVAAARMNAELGTKYDLNKMMNWCFDVGPLREWAHTTGWGTVVGKWNGMDASGLVAAISKPGNTDFGDYAFIMNNFQLCGILAPVARYDTQYARALGKYLLNASNAMRWFYSKYLPKENQDCFEWSSKNDPNSCIAYESLRQFKDGKSPFATGDAMKANWAKTNLSLYSSAPVGYLGGILETTNVEAILKFDLLKTDFSHSQAYPTFLYYNPYKKTKTVILNLGAKKYTLYEATNNVLITDSATGNFKLKIAPDNAIVIVLAPEKGTITYDNNKMLIDNIIVDFNRSGSISLN